MIEEDENKRKMLKAYKLRTQDTMRSTKFQACLRLLITYDYPLQYFYTVSYPEKLDLGKIFRLFNFEDIFT